MKENLQTRGPAPMSMDYFTAILLNKRAWLIYLILSPEDGDRMKSPKRFSSIETSDG
jgi:hypothetical protein